MLAVAVLIFEPITAESGLLSSWSMSSLVNEIKCSYNAICVRCGGLMVSVLVFGLSGLGSSPGQGHCVVFLGKTLYSHGAPLHPGV